MENITEKSGETIVQRFRIMQTHNFVGFDSSAAKARVLGSDWGICCASIVDSAAFTARPNELAERAR